MRNKSELIENICVVFIIAAMVAASELTGEKEIIFPEIAALAVGSFLAPKMVWQTSYTRMIICVSLCALTGVGIVRLIPGALWAQVLLAYIIGQIILMFSGTSFAPMISAIALPVLLQTESMVYPVSAFVLTAATALMRIILEKTGIKKANVYQPLPRLSEYWKNSAADIVIRSAAAGLGAFLCISAGMKFCVAPPLLVAFTELTRQDCPAGKRRLQTLALVSLCALAGALCRYFIVMLAGAPFAVAAVVIAAAVIVLVKSLKLYFPPAGAMAVLALLIPDGSVASYPVQVFLGITAAAVVSWIIIYAKQRFKQ